MYETKFHLPIAVRNVLPVDAQEVFRVAANESAAAGAEYNEVMRAGWAKVGEGWATSEGDARGLGSATPSVACAP